MADVKRYSHLARLFGRDGPLAGEGFEPGAQAILEELKSMKILVIGAGGLGCDIVKCLALSGFHNIDIIDMDTIDASNLNRQFLFRAKDVGTPKASAAAAFINSRIDGCTVTPHCCKIQAKPFEFYQQFQVIVCGLDNIGARRWINSTVNNLLEWDEGEDEDDAEVDFNSIITLVDSGTEGMRGNIRVVIPSMSSCIECNVEMFPPPVGIPLCTIAATPRNAAHCIQYAGLFAWEDYKPFRDEQGNVLKYDTDNAGHVAWISDFAQKRADEFNIQEACDVKKTLGVLKNIIPAIASTNALIAAAACNEALKCQTGVTHPLSNYMLFNGESGAYTGPQELAKNENCAVCSNNPQVFHTDQEITLGELRENLLAVPQYALKNPRMIYGDEVLYMSSGPAALRAIYDANLTKQVKDIFEDKDLLTISETFGDNGQERVLTLILDFSEGGQ